MGYGVVSGELPLTMVSAWGRRLERHRFRFMSAVQGRKHALSDLDPFNAAEAVEDFSGECEGRYVVDGSFEEISLPALRKAVWNVRYGTRCLTLLDNMSRVLALSQSRARSFRLLLLARRACAIGLACHCR